MLTASFVKKCLRKESKLAKPNYSGEKRRKDLAKKAKKEEKRLKKLQARENPDSGDVEVSEVADTSSEVTNDQA